MTLEHERAKANEQLALALHERRVLDSHLQEEKLIGAANTQRVSRPYQRCLLTTDVQSQGSRCSSLTLSTVTAAPR